MKPSFTLAVVLCFAALIAVVMGAALSTLVDGALRSQTLGLDLLAGETAATLRQSLEKVFRRATTSMLTQRNATKRVGYPFAPPSPDAASQAVNATSAHRQWMALTLGAASMIPPFSVIVVRWAVSGAALSSSRGPGSTQGQLCQVLNPRPLPTQLADINVNCTLQAYQETDLAVPNTSSLLVGFVAPARSAYLAAAWNATRQIMLNPPPKFGAWQDQVQFYSQLQYFIAKNASETVETFLAPFVTMSFEPDGVTPIAMLIGSMAYSHFDAVLRDLVSGVPGACALLVRRATITTAGQPPSDRVISDSSGSTFTVMFSNETGGSVWNGCAVFGARIGCLYNISTHPPYEILRLRIAQLPAASGEVTLASGEQYYGFTQQLSNDFFAFPFEVHVFLPRAYFFAAIERARVVTVLVAVLVSVLGVALACPLLLRMAASVGDLADRLHDPFSPLSTSDSGGVAAAVTATGITGWLCPFCSSFEVEEVAALEREFAAFREVIAVVRGFMYADGGRGGGVEHLGDPIDSSGFVASSTDTSAPTDTSRLEIAPMPAANVVTIAVGSIGAAATDDAAADKSMTSSSKRRRNVQFAATVVDRAGPSAARPVKPKCFVACVHVFGFQSLRLRHEARARIADVTITKGRGSTAALAVERECMQSADSQMISAELISFSTFVIERFGRLARSVGATLFELHGDHFLVCVRIRDAFKSKMPVRFADRLIELADLLDEYARAATDDQRKQIESRPTTAQVTAAAFVPVDSEAATAPDPTSASDLFDENTAVAFANAAVFENSNNRLAVRALSAGFACGDLMALRMVGDGASFTRPVTFFAPCFAEAIAIEQVMRTAASADIGRIMSASSLRPATLSAGSTAHVPAATYSSATFVPRTHAIGVLVNRRHLFSAARTASVGRLYGCIREGIESDLYHPLVLQLVSVRDAARGVLYGGA